MAVKTKLTIEEQINRLRESTGISQTFIVLKMKEAGLVMNDAIFSRKKKGREVFTPEELKALSEILGTPIEA